MIFRPAPGVRCAVADNPGPMTLDGTRSYLIGEEAAVLLDPGPAGESQEGRIRGLVDGRNVMAVALTHAHPDHAGGARRVARRLGAPIAASAATLERIGLAAPGEGGGPGADGGSAGARPGVIALSDGDEIELDGGASRLRALETPGHASDHLCFLWLPRAAVFTGDLVLGTGTAMVGDPDGHMGSYLASLERLLELRPVRLFPGHGEPVEDAARRLEDYLGHRRGREEQIRAALEEGADSVAAIRRRVYGELPEGLDWAAEASIRAHLVHLEEGGHELPPLAGREPDDRDVH